MTTSPSPTLRELRALPVSERRETLEELLVTEFKAALLMTEDDELPFDQSYFDLGLTSLGITDLKQRLEQVLDCEIDANVLFNSPTVERLLTHLIDDLIAGAGRPPAGPPAPTGVDRALVGAALSDLYEQ